MQDLIAQPEQSQEVQNITAFNRLFGYVKYFHPSDQAFENDWDYFAIYGVERVRKCEDDKALMATLDSLFKPLAPTLEISKKPKEVNAKTAYPDDIENYLQTYWQHEGVNYGSFLLANDTTNIYRSVRVGHPYSVMAEDEEAGFSSHQQINEEWLGKKFRLKGEFKFEYPEKNKKEEVTRPYLFTEVDGARIESSFLTTDGLELLLEGTFFDDAELFEVGVNVSNGTLTVFDISLEVEIDGVWTRQSLPYKHFMVGGILDHASMKTWGREAYSFRQEFIEKRVPLIIDKHQKTVEISGSPIFEETPLLEEGFQIELENGIWASAPYVLCYNSDGTYPEPVYPSNEREIAETEYHADSISSKLGNLISTWNVLRFFHPNVELVEWDYHAAFRIATKKLLNGTDWSVTMEQMVNPLHDAHLSFIGEDYHFPPFTWEMLDDYRVVITAVSPRIDELKVGDVIWQVGEEPANRYFEDYYRLHSSFSEASVKYFQNLNSLRGERGSSMLLTKENGERVIVDRTLDYPYEPRTNKQSINRISDEVLYFNVGLILNESEYKNAMRQMMEVDFTILDFRNDINREVDGGTFDTFFRKSYSKPEGSKWMHVHQRIYPDRELVGKNSFGLTDSVAEPHVNPFPCKIICLIDGGVASYPETVLMMLEEHQDDLLIIGQQTAGGNGDVNPFVLPGGTMVFFSGMEVRKFDGSSFYGVAILPDIEISRTYEDIVAGRDPYLERALEEIRKQGK